MVQRILWKNTTIFVYFCVLFRSFSQAHLFMWALKQWPDLGSHQQAKALARSGRLLVNASTVADFHHLSDGDHITLRLEFHVLSLKHTFRRHQTVSTENAGVRLESYCKTFFHDILTSRRALREAVKQGSIRVNGQQVEHTRMLSEGSVVEVTLPAVQVLEALCPKHCWPRIIYEDDFLAVCWKDPQVKSMGGWQTAENGARLQVKFLGRKPHKKNTESRFPNSLENYHVP